LNPTAHNSAWIASPWLAYPSDSRLLELARLAQRAGIILKQT
jgi:hypothetical protein